MRPEDENIQRVQHHNDSLAHNWNAKDYERRDGNLSPKNGIHSTNGYISANSVLKPSNESQTWIPLLGHHPSDIDHTLPTTNNNKWPSLTSSANLSNSNYMWKELPQDDGAIGLYKSHLGNGNALTGLRNGHNIKNGEHESLTGIVRSPIDEQHNDSIDDDVGPECGIGLCKPRWMRMFASTHVFMVIFLLAWILQGMYCTYFVSVITTIEKLFQIKSKTIGLLMSVTEIGQISTSLLLTYYAGRGHRPRWIACGMIVFAFATFGCTLPHFIFGNELLSANDAFYGNGGSSSSNDGVGNAFVNDLSTSMALRNASDPLLQSVDVSGLNLCRIPNLNSTIKNEACSESVSIEQQAHAEIRNAVLGILFFCLLFVGIGQTAVATLGIPYIDDNVACKDSAIYMAITLGVRILGPAAGFVLGSFCTRLYVNLDDPGFGPSDPKWVGAWWLGLVLISSMMVFTAIAMFSFPKQLRGYRIASSHQSKQVESEKIKDIEKKEVEEKPKLKDFPKTIRRMLKNDILMFRTASSVLHLLPIAGLYTFLPKYLESQFHLPAHDANLISGTGGILVMGIGITISAIFLLRFNLTARSVAAWIAITALIYSLGMAILMFVGCSLENFVGLDSFNGHVESDSLSFMHTNLTDNFSTCNLNCECDKNKFSPICGVDGKTYYSSCHVGCRSMKIVEGKTLYTECGCLPAPDNFTENVQAHSGFCDDNCKSFVLFISIFSFLVFVHSTSEVGSMLLTMRCTDPKDKAMAMGIIQFAIGLFGNVPCPIIYGAVIDSTCLIWETICGKQGACSLYDPDTFRRFFLGTTSVIMFLAFIMDVIVWSKANRIDIDPESKAAGDQQQTEGKDADKMMPSSSTV